MERACGLYIMSILEQNLVPFLYKVTSDGENLTLI